MKKWQTLKDGQGNECILFPMDYMKITQGNNGQYSHQGVNALDIAGRDSGIEEVYCPVSLKYMWSDTAKNGNALFLESVKPVKWADGTLDYASFMTIHDNYIGDIIALVKQGHIFKQGEPISDEGTAGFATGNHCHIEVKKGKLQWNKYKNSYGGGLGYYQINSQGVYQLQDSVPSDQAFFIDGTILYNNGQTIDSGNKMFWKSFKDLKEFSEKDLIPEHAIAILTEDQIRARLNSPTGAVLRLYKKGSKIEYTHKYVGNGHRYISWKENGKTVLLAVSGSEERGVDPWATFEEIKEKPAPAKPKPEPVQDFTKNVKMWGIDVSEHNADKYNIEDYDFVIIRATYGENTDKWFRKNVERCKKANKPFGLYCYSYAINDEQMYAESEYFLNAIKGIDIPMGCWFDMEDADGWKVKHSALTKEHCTKAAQVFCDMISNAGYYVGVYSTPEWFRTMVITDRPKWIAHWGTNNGKLQYDYSNQAVLYQYAANPMDKNVCYVDIKTLASHPKKDEQETKPAPEVAKPQEEKLNIGALNKLINKLLSIFK